ncbi:hypothetical protein RQP46_006296 [Phenoliferia psychrophenolica]
MGLRVTLPTTPPQILQGFTTTSPVTAHSSPKASSATGVLTPVNKWLGVPFGTAERFAIATPYELEYQNAGVRECFEFGPTPLQPLGSVEPFWLQRKGWMDRDFVGDGEDCLSLNIFAPAMASEELKSLPVLVWIYGGGLATGHSAAVRFDATELLLYLNWIQRHISLFGGDPTRTTVWGESAGAISIAALTARRLSPSSPTLFHRAILHSGFPSSMPFKPPGYNAWEELLAEFSLSSLPTAAERVAGLRAIPARDLLEFVKTHGTVGGFGGTIEKGGLWEIQPEARYKAGEWDRSVTSWILGCNLHEGTLCAHVLPGKVSFTHFGTHVSLNY